VDNDLTANTTVGYTRLMEANGGKRQVTWPARITMRCGLLACLECAIGFVLRWTSGPELAELREAAVAGHAPAGGWTLERLVVDTSACLACVGFVLLVTSTVATLASALGWPTWWRLGGLGGPHWWRRAVLCACGLGLTSQLAANPGLADDGHPHSSCSTRCVAGQPGPSQLSGLPLPDLPDSPHAGRTLPGSVLVRSGDSLWLIARRDLSPSASDSAVCRRVDALYAANRATIGADPDLIFPRTILTLPGGTS